MENVIKRSQEDRHGTGITLDSFRFNAVVNHFMFTGRRGIVYRRIVKLSGAQQGDSVLDVGSSTGYLTRRLAAAALPEGRVIGVDPSKPAIAYARRHARPGLTFTVGIAQELDLPDSSFDVVTCALAMHHIPAAQRRIALAEMYRVTKPGGRLLVADALAFMRLATGRRERQADGAAHPLEDLAATAGYRVQSTGRLPILDYVVAVRPLASRD